MSALGAVAVPTRCERCVDLNPILSPHEADGTRPLIVHFSHGFLRGD